MMDSTMAEMMAELIPRETNLAEMMAEMRAHYSAQNLVVTKAQSMALLGSGLGLLLCSELG